jgi:hypothetical protein
MQLLDRPIDQRTSRDERFFCYAAADEQPINVVSGRVDAGIRGDPGQRAAGGCMMIVLLRAVAPWP